MKSVNVRNLQRLVGECVSEAQGDMVVVTRRGQPAAVLVGVEGYDWEDVYYMTNPRFWAEVRRWREEPVAAFHDELPDDFWTQEP